MTIKSFKRNKLSMEFQYIFIYNRVSIHTYIYILMKFISIFNKGQIYISLNEGNSSIS